MSINVFRGGFRVGSSLRRHFGEHSNSLHQVLKHLRCVFADFGTYGLIRKAIGIEKKEEERYENGTWKTWKRVFQKRGNRPKLPGGISQKSGNKKSARKIHLWLHASAKKRLRYFGTEEASDREAVVSKIEQRGRQR
jgi:hypothetical protein